MPSSNLIVACIIRQPMDTVGIKTKYRSLHQASSKAIAGLDKENSNKVLSTARSSKSYVNSGSIRAGISSSVGPSMSRSGLNRSQNGLDVTKSSSMSANRSASRPRGHSHDSRSNNSAGGAKRRSSLAAKNGAMGKLPNAYKHPHILTTLQPSRFVLRSPAGL